MPKFIDLTGQKIGQLTILSRAENKGKKIYWNCQCSCGKIIERRGDGLKEDGKGNPSCGCLRMQHTAEAVSKDLVGQVFGRLTVLERTTERSGNGGVKWKCQCSCGNIKNITTDSLHSGTKSCGCLQKEIAKETLAQNMKDKITKVGDILEGFEVLEVEFKPTNAGHNEAWVKTICPYCNSIFWTRAHYLKVKDVNSCGCKKIMSKGEEKIKQILDTNNISYEQQKVFKDCKDKTPLRFDFFVDDNYIIEYDGEQHYFPVAFSGNLSEAQNQYEQNIKRDEIKNKWCENNNIPIIRIPYYLKEISLKDLIPSSSEYLI